MGDPVRCLPKVVHPDVAALKLQHNQRTGYSRRAMVENTIYRYKTIIGRAMTSRTLVGQRVEVRLACRVLNTMTRLGMPDSYRVA